MGQIRRVTAGALLTVASALALAACGSSDSGSSTSTSANSAATSGGGQLTVWADATRVEQVRAYARAHPQADLKIVTIPADAGYVSTKVQLANRTRKGWPDVVFLATPSEISALQGPPYNYAAPLDDVIGQDVRDGFAPSTITNCTFGGRVVCIQNDLAQTVLWYDAPLMRRLGYDVPRTWDEYAALGERVAREHPGMVVGAFGDHMMEQVFYGSSGCPIKQTTGADSVRIDLHADECTRVNELLQPLIDNRSVSLSGLFDPEFTRLMRSEQVLMLPMASWMGDFGFKALRFPAGRLTATTMPTWPGEDVPYAGTVGGGVWAISQHTGDKVAAGRLVEWLTTDTRLQQGLTTYPAFEAAADAWARAKADDDYYAADPVPAMQEEAGKIRENWNYVRYEAAWQPSFAEIVVAGLKKGDKLEALMDPWQDRLVEAAQTAGYSVEQQ
ncbi:ABC transporter substrate-binding protein [Conexibacter sp. JD483]|uniref:ABC transporter substrate-binding protein n=1 Tax=unclassified Conexibacter TaxID=2627773 RepID=UPI002717F441|nr:MULTISPECIES: ABC transporter substrate-binding protein [unclassified Conexibacter]MDO8185198.1 ABC transporter substrate-binding protein [Conexibacter sp. CPCC 205706]MDO8198244.1 ABC transporter substrate-binding protein [Conexibacter sp. CPCC 205762]MDR9367794.1 ABC transporter substrate-binding protein [Conexibacter sp. JD483]